MADYAIGDIQGCYEPLMRLLEAIDFDDSHDQLWFVGDLVNRGPQSLQVLEFIRQLKKPAYVTLGNHDLYLLRLLLTDCGHKNADDTLHDILSAPNREEIALWLRQQSILIHEKRFNIVMTHAGIAPMWDLDLAKNLAVELETVLKGSSCPDFLANMFGNQPDCWVSSLTGMARLRTICNYFTRMRFCDQSGKLLLDYKGTIEAAPKGYYPWYDVPNRAPITAEIVFGHWAALAGKYARPGIHAIDTGCLWGGQLTALRLQDKKRISVSGL